MTSVPVSRRSLLCFSLLLLSAIVLCVYDFSATAQERSRHTSGQQPTSRTVITDRSVAPEIEVVGTETKFENGATVCRDLTSREARALWQRDPQQLRSMRVITPERGDSQLEGAEAAQAQTSLKIVLRGTQQLDSFPQAKAAFLKAAATWEAQIRTPITIVIDVDFGPTRFGQTYPSGVLGSTANPSYLVDYPTMRQQLLINASSSQKTTLYHALPATSVPSDIGSINNVVVPGAVLRALGLLNPVADPTNEPTLGPPPSIGFNANFSFDFDPSDGISPSQTDFDAVAVHEIGHVLGFTSYVGYFELSPFSTNRLTIWDLFRFRSGTTLATFASAQRVLSSGGVQNFFAGGPELPLSTGRPDGSGGDGKQASHWKADELNNGLYIGIMDPTLSRGVRETLTNNDLIALESLGYVTALNTNPTPTPTPTPTPMPTPTPTPTPVACSFTISPASQSFAASGGAGSVSITASAATCARTAVSNAAWITISSGSSGNGNGIVAYQVVANNIASSRSGTLTIAGKTFTVSQAAGNCTFTLSHNSAAFTSVGGTNNRVRVLASASSCAWTASTTATWITGSYDSSGLTYSVEANNTASPRTGVITIAGQPFTVTQSAAGDAACSYQIGGVSESISNSGGRFTVSVRASGSCAWRVVSNVPWITIRVITGSSVSFNVLPNSGPLRSGTVTVAGKIIPIVQSGSGSSVNAVAETISLSHK